ncbi:carboxypeptidase A2-like [Neocloeon triangulifer]|uniref:carboxypeptidase A2-like n=1 Tax=Neocloeon triangulifer TaxID=2078957 RepID=UPI00286ECFF1|nr:carboxypeptidase A2-like [Neocloeon triangulifer]
MKLLVFLLLLAAAGVLCSAGAPSEDRTPSASTASRALKDNKLTKDEETEDDDEISLGSFFNSIFGFFRSGFQSVFGGDEEAEVKESKQPPKYKRVFYKRWRLYRATPRSQDQLDEMNTVEEDFDKVSYWKRPTARNESCDFIVPPGMVDVIEDFLKERQINYEVVSPDLQKSIEAANPRMTKERRDALKNEIGHSLTWRRYHRYTDILGYMDYLKRNYPDMVSTIKIGKSTGGLPLRVLKISTPQAKNSEPKPAIWIDGGTHAREWISPAVTTYMIKQLVEYSKTNRLIVNSFDWYILPVLNPDGYEYSHTTDRLWRKTRSENEDEGRALWSDLFSFCYNKVGVDPNRNWDFHWGKEGASDSPCAETYAGPKAFSEPEVKAVADFLMENKEKFKIFLTLHSYGQMWLLPWSFTEEKVIDHDDLMNLGKKATDAIANIRGTKYKLGPTTKYLYHSAGSADDWAKGVAGIKYSYTVELPDKGLSGFLLPASEIISTGKETFAGIKAMARGYLEEHHPNAIIEVKKSKPPANANKPNARPTKPNARPTKPNVKPANNQKTTSTTSRPTTTKTISSSQLLKRKADPQVKRNTPIRITVANDKPTSNQSARRGRSNGN